MAKRNTPHKKRGWIKTVNCHFYLSLLLISFVSACFHPCRTKSAMRWRHTQETESFSPRAQEYVSSWCFARLILQCIFASLLIESKLPGFVGSFLGFIGLVHVPSKVHGHVTFPRGCSPLVAQWLSLPLWTQLRARWEPVCWKNTQGIGQGETVFKYL